jgi:hypothetical protein
MPRQSKRIARSEKADSILPTVFSVKITVFESLGKSVEKLLPSFSSISIKIKCEINIINKGN